MFEFGQSDSNSIRLNTMHSTRFDSCHEHMNQVEEK